MLHSKFKQMSVGKGRGEACEGIHADDDRDVTLILRLQTVPYRVNCNPWLP